ncbi:carbamoyl-phosphate synthase large subunit [Seleniivibrio woodruffii]|uniref:Carbamoyl phosphate synthase large chain n=1 Tax=Seleniivibrio woodruffii TaxID=1078050 RepID=A0A4R1KC73_9BACT|nr:carbamoyl-phosphate synthase large subunit [Seleniivibrio woodruffii]TCK60739.1 carbamoyl-phosphate synthase large subunit [Seleniivibrio woodruffii]TVZ36369.1 carbamoyl-phosphate synthase large subunit [Seleniivibrio woodruffii]
MAKRTDIKSIMIIGSGPIVIGQACEFDYSGTQAVKALKEEGYRVILINSNPATIMTDPEIADATYIEPLNVEMAEKIIAKERPDAILPTVGGQTALNLAKDLHAAGVLEKYNVELIGAKIEAIDKAEDRELFKQAMKKIGLTLPESYVVNTYQDALDCIDKIGFPAIIRPSFTLGGTGGNVAYNMEEYKEYVEWGLEASPVTEILVEESVLGWKEYELEVMRDLNDNVVIICSIENIDAMGVHTGDSITVAPAQTLTDKEYQVMRNAALAVIREIGVDTGGSNVQFAVDPKTGKQIIIEMNPRVSRSSALASKATGFPIAKIAAKLAVGYTLDELKNDITLKTPASFEPTIDYCVTKFPRFTFEKFPGADNTLTTQMKSVGEAMSIGRTFKESMQKAISSLEIGKSGFDEVYSDEERMTETAIENIKSLLRRPTAERMWYVGEAFRAGFSVQEVHELCFIDPWFLDNIKQIIDFEEVLKKYSITSIDDATFLKAKQMGFSDKRLAKLMKCTELQVWEKTRGKAVYKRVDTCGAEFESFTPYLYSTYEKECEAEPTDKKKIMILGGGPNRIGQGIEFDYCCVHASFALEEMGFETIMVNCNPETVSTDYDTSDRLYFEPLTREHVLNIVEKEKPFGVIVQFGGQTPLKLAVPLEKAGVPILGTSPDSIDIAEDRERFKDLITRLNIKQPPNGIAKTAEEAYKIAEEIGYPVVVRPSYVLGGRAMEIVYDTESLQSYMVHAVQASDEHPVLIDKYLQHATEVDVDSISDGEITVIGSIMQHIEEAGVHSGDSACSIPSRTINDKVRAQLLEHTRNIAKELKVIGLMNIQYAIKDDEIYMLEVNPRASRTIPYVSKTIGVPLAKMAAKVMAGAKLKDLGFTKEVDITYFTVKESVFPFVKFPGTDLVLGPEMKSTGEVMGIDSHFGSAFYKAQIAAGNKLPKKGNVFISVKDSVKDEILGVAKELVKIGFKLVSTAGTYGFLKENGLEVEKLAKVHEGVRPNVIDKIKNGEIAFVINIPESKKSRLDSESIRRTILSYSVPYVTTVEAAKACVVAIEAGQKGLTVTPIQDYYKRG